MTKFEFLNKYAPPPEFVRWFHRVIEEKRSKGEDVPAKITEWLDRWSETLGHTESQLIEDLKTVELMEF